MNNCALQCDWVLTEGAAILRQQEVLTDTAKQQSQERGVAEGYYAELIDAAQGEDPEVEALARSYAQFDRDHEHRENATQTERNARDDTMGNIVLANGSLALKTCSGPDRDGLCTGDVREEHSLMLSLYRVPQE